MEPLPLCPLFLLKVLLRGLLLLFQFEQVEDSACIVVCQVVGRVPSCSAWANTAMSSNFVRLCTELARNLAANHWAPYRANISRHVSSKAGGTSQ